MNYQRIGAIKAEELERMVCLERLFLRWNLIKKIENLETFTSLVELELYGNQLTEIVGLDTLVNLEYVGSGNLFHSQEIANEFQPKYLWIVTGQYFVLMIWNSFRNHEWRTSCFVCDHFECISGRVYFCLQNLGPFVQPNH